MLTASNKVGKPEISFDANKSDGPFFCPECGCHVMLKKGDSTIHHFAHFPDSSCGYGGGESETHIRIKTRMFNSLKNHQNVESCELEKYLESVRPDIFFVRKSDGQKCAIEIQLSQIDPATISKRMSEYSKKDIPVLWVLYFKARDRDHTRLMDWQYLIWKMCRKEIYIYSGGHYVSRFLYSGTSKIRVSDHPKSGYKNQLVLLNQSLDVVDNFTWIDTKKSKIWKAGRRDENGFFEWPVFEGIA